MAIRYSSNQKSHRLKGWNYANPGWYFITINSYQFQPFFGSISNGIMGLSIPGCAAWHFWRQIPNHHLNAKLDAFIVMPNHVHGIIRIENDFNSEQKVQTLHATSVPEQSSKIMSDISPKKGSLSVIIRSYKSAVTRYCHQHGFEDFAWHTKFYDRIIRDQRALDTIRKYIYTNPLRWNKNWNH